MVREANFASRIFSFLKKSFAGVKIPSFCLLLQAETGIVTEQPAN